ncbi:NACHT and ankyrin domain protein [Colletotrichum musicola]|uniref:NACHT and ankyrin domain protein n=1 Tax=Colletotrichum musicola TaxID=2175873 RepID=A0A8H6IY56_9PEZI|nr:NACHT and ankyrin domain protein [Colletotrichum musicola]
MASSKLKSLEGPDSYTVGWIAALPIERAAAVAILEEKHAEPKGFIRHPNDTNVYTWGRIGDHNVAIASLAAGICGLTSAATTASSLSASLPSIRIGLLVGIGGAIPRPNDDRDIRLGDVVVSQPDGTTGGVCQYDLVKAKTGDRRERKGFLGMPPTVLLKALASIQADHELEDSQIPNILQDMLQANPKMAKRSRQSPGYIHQGVDNDRLFHPSYEHVSSHDCGSCEVAGEIHRDPRHSTDPEIHYGIIASGNTLVKDGISRDRIVADIGENCICFEMEAAGLMNHFPCLVIRGICDYADSHKNDRWQRYASATAAAYAKELLSYVPASEVQEARRALEILQSVEQTVESTKRVTVELKTTLESFKHESRREKIFEWLAAPDPSSNANHARKLRHKGTGSWLLKSPKFQDWVLGTLKHLWLRGIPGCGKTVLSTIVLDHLPKNNNQVVLSFFFDFSETEKQTFDGMLRSLATQLYQGGFDSNALLDSSLKAHSDGQNEPTTETLEFVVRNMLAALENVVIVLDALDESTTRARILSWIHDLFSTPDLSHVQLIYTSREEADFMQHLPGLIGEHCCLTMNSGSIDADIYSYVTEILQQDSRFTDKQLSEDLIAEILHKVGSGGNGMFRWAACQIDSLAGCTSPRAIKDHLNMLPRDLNETYERIIQSIPQDFKEKATRLLQFLLYSEEPLSLQQAVEVIATNFEEEPPHFSIDSRLFRELDILRHCPSLVSVVEIEYFGDLVLVLHLAHFSVMEYLLLQPPFERSNACTTITRTCLSYLRDISGDKWDLTGNFPLALYASGYWLSFAQIAQSSAELVSEIVSFLQDKDVFNRWVFLAELGGGDDWDSYQDLPRGPGLHYASIGGLTAVIRSMTESGADVDAQGRKFGNALQAAVFHGHLDTAQLLIEKGANVNYRGGLFGNALVAACHQGRLDIVRLLLENCADVNLQGGRHGSALNAASKQGHHEIVKMLLDQGADMNTQEQAIPSSTLTLRSALQSACRHGHSSIVQLLLERGARFNPEGGSYGDSLRSACFNGHSEVVQLLLEKRGDVSLRGYDSETSIQAACHGGKENIMGPLPDAVNSTNNNTGDFTRALRAASSQGNDIIVKMLVDAGADVNSLDQNRGTALQVACRNGHERVVKMLLDLGADGNAQNDGSQHPLLISFSSDDQRIFNMLVASGADLSTLVGDYESTLKEACLNGDLVAVEMLLDLRADSNSKDIEFDILLKAADCSDGNAAHTLPVDADEDFNNQDGTEWRRSTIRRVLECISDRENSIEVLLIRLGAAIRNGGKYDASFCPVYPWQQRSLVTALVELGKWVKERCLIDPCATASFGGLWDIVLWLLRQRGEATNTSADDSTPPLSSAILDGYSNVAKLLIHKGMDVNAAHGTAWTPLMAAIYRQPVDMEVFSLLLEKGADASKSTSDGWTPLLLASEKGRPNGVSLLLERCSVDLNHRHSEYGQTALSFAAEMGHEAIVELLLSDARTDTGTPDFLGRTAIFHAARIGRKAVVSALLARLAPANLPDIYGSTPLSAAARLGHVGVVKALLAADAASLSPDYRGRTPLWWAKRSGHTEIFHLLLEYCQRNKVSLANETSPEVITKLQESSSGYCDICLFGVSDDCGRYICPICMGGHLFVCEDCFASGGHCLDQSHGLVRKAGWNAAKRRHRDSIDSLGEYKHF